MCTDDPTILTTSFGLNDQSYALVDFGRDLLEQPSRIRSGENIHDEREIDPTQPVVDVTHELARDALRLSD